MSLEAGGIYCLCGNKKEKYQEMCEECKSISKNRDHRKKVGVKLKIGNLSVGGKCDLCSNSCSKTSNLCIKCYSKWVRGKKTQVVK